MTLEVAAVAVLAVEQDATGSNIRTASDALWWGYVTMTTVGYGDLYPVTNPGRVVGAFMMTLGVALFATFTGYLANSFLGPRRRRTNAKLNVEPGVADLLGALLEQQERLMSEMRSRLDEMQAAVSRPDHQP